MAGAYVLDEADIAYIKATGQMVRQLIAGGHAQLGNRNPGGEYPIVRLGIAYGAMLPAVYDSTGKLVSAGKAECKLHRLTKDGTGTVGLDDQPTVCYNLMPEIIPDGAEALFLRDRTIEDPEHPERLQPGYLCIGTRGTSRSGYAQLLTSFSPGTTAHSVIFEFWDHAENGTTNAIFNLPLANVLDTPNTDKQGIQVKIPGMYLVGWNAVLDITTGTGNDLQVDSLGQNLCDKIAQDGVTLFLTINDNAVTPQVDPIEDIIGAGTSAGHPPVELTSRRMCGHAEQGNGNHVSPVVLEADDIVRMWYEPTAATPTRSVVTCDMWLMYIGPEPGYVSP